MELITNMVFEALECNCVAIGVIMASLAFGLVVVMICIKVAMEVWWRPFCARRDFVKQGLPCLPYHLLLGNSREISAMAKAARSSPLPHHCHNISPHIFPHFLQWRKDYGDLFVYWMGSRPVLPVTDPELVREILFNKHGQFRKLELKVEAKAISGDSIPTLEGARWAQHRRIVNPAFFVEKLKAMTPTMVRCIAALLDKWETQVTTTDEIKELDVHEEFKVLTADIIAHTAFGSSYKEGKSVFKLQYQQQIQVLKIMGNPIHVPGLRFLPTSQNREAKRLKNEIEEILQGIIESREGSSKETGSAEDLLGLLMAANRVELSSSQRRMNLSMQEIVDECKAFFFAGHESTANLLTWATMLLATHQEWQERARQEVLQSCGNKQSPHADSLHNLKLVGMVIYEAMRLYPPLPLMFRETMKKMKLGNIVMPPNTKLFLPILFLHHDLSIWGPDAHDFNPHRFANGIANACNTPLAYFPFSMGPRSCVGQNFALLEAKLILSMILQRFHFSLSPGYKHAPTTLFTLQPQYGMQINFRLLSK